MEEKTTLKDSGELGFPGEGEAAGGGGGGGQKSFTFGTGMLMSIIFLMPQLIRKLFQTHQISSCHMERSTFAS